MGGEFFSHCDISIPSPLARFYRPQLGFLHSAARLWVSPGASRKRYQLCPPLPMCLPFSPTAWFSLACITLWIQYICLCITIFAYSSHPETQKVSSGIFTSSVLCRVSAFGTRCGALQGLSEYFRMKGEYTHMHMCVFLGRGLSLSSQRKLCPQRDHEPLT